MVATTVLSSADVMKAVDAATIAVSGLSCYYSSVVAMVPFSAVTAVDVITSDADANLPVYVKKGVQTALLFFNSYFILIIIPLLIRHLST